MGLCSAEGDVAGAAIIEDGQSLVDHEPIIHMVTPDRMLVTIVDLLWFFSQAARGADQLCPPSWRLRMSAHLLARVW